MNLIDVHKTFATDEQWRLCAASVRRARAESLRFTEEKTLSINARRR